MASENFYLSFKATYIILVHKKMKFFVKDFYSKCDQMRSFLRIWSRLLKKSLFVQCSAFLLEFSRNLSGICIIKEPLQIYRLILGELSILMNFYSL